MYMCSLNAMASAVCKTRQLGKMLIWKPKLRMKVINKYCMVILIWLLQVKLFYSQSILNGSFFRYNTLIKATRSIDREIYISINQRVVYNSVTRIASAHLMPAFLRPSPLFSNHQEAL
jgi:hypothetical protein